MSMRRLSLLLVLIGAVFALWPVKADRTRYELEAGVEGRPLSELQSQWADPQLRQILQRRPTCGIPLLAPFTYIGDTALRRGCAGPNSRSLSLSLVAVAAGWGVLYGAPASGVSAGASEVGLAEVRRLRSLSRRAAARQRAGP